MVNLRHRHPQPQLRQVLRENGNGDPLGIDEHPVAVDDHRLVSHQHGPGRPATPSRPGSASMWRKVPAPPAARSPASPASCAYPYTCHPAPTPDVPPGALSSPTTPSSSELDPARPPTTD